jgi:hypothetical protein
VKYVLNTHFIGNLVDMSRRSFTYEERLYKYAQRGFEVGIPCIDLSTVDVERLSGKLPEQCKGLTKLLVYHLSEKTRRPYYDLDWAFHATPFKLARIHSIKCQQLVQPQVENQSPQNKRWQGSDYGYLPRWGLFTPESIQGLYNNHKTTFKMRDSTSILLCPLESLF